MKMEKNDKLDSWDNFISDNFLKAIEVKSEEDEFVCTSINIFTDENNSQRPRLELERNKTKWIFDLNKTNAKKVSELGVQTPRQLIGKTIYFRKVLVRNPQTNQEVDGLRISKIN